MRHIGIDEVGRGPIAGPVAVAVFAYTGKIKNPPGLPLRDSKKLTQAQREKWFAYLKEQKNCSFAVSLVSPQVIDSKGIAYAISLALQRSLQKLKISPREKILLDGGLKAPPIYTKQETVIKGDEIHPCISFASIVAKVTRDRYMYTQARKYPIYGFERHVGYGTASHYKAIATRGLTPIHRKSFLH